MVITGVALAYTFHLFVGNLAVSSFIMKSRNRMYTVTQ